MQFTDNMLTSDGNVIDLPQCLDGDGLDALKISLCDELASPIGGPIVINAGAVARVGTRGLQLLVATQRSAEAASRPFIVRDGSDALKAALSSAALTIPLS